MTSLLRERLRAALLPAIRARDKVATAAIRSALGALDNAEAVPTDPTATSTGDGLIAGARIGLGAGEADRRELTEQEVLTVVGAEITDRLAAAEEVQAAGVADRAELLRAEAAVLETFLGP